MKKKILLTTFAFVFAKLLLAQIPSQISTVWQYQVRDTITNPYLQSSDFRPLGDSAVVFLTTEYDAPPTSFIVKKIAFYLSKISSGGSLLVNRKRIQLPSSTFSLKNFSNTQDGGLIVLASVDRSLPGLGLQTDSAYLARYDNNLSLVWQKFIFNGNDGSIYGTVVKEATVLDNGKIIVNYERVLPSRPFPGSFGALITAFTPIGDSLYKVSVENSINKVLKGSGNTFFTRESITFSSTKPVFLRSSADGSVIKENSLINIGSFTSAPPPSKNFISLKYLRFNSINGPSNFALQITDSLLNVFWEINYNNVTLFKYWQIDLIKDKNNGLYAYQQIQQGSSSEFFGPYPGQDYFALCRLDHAGRELWSFKLDNPLAAAGGRIGEILPLPGNDFIIPVFTSTGVTVYRLSANFTTPNLAPQMQISTTEAVTSLQKEKIGIAVKDLSVKVAPNPTANYFTIAIKSNNTEKIAVTVTNVLGNILERKINIQPNSTIQIGDNYRSGIYFVEVMQNGKSEILKLVKE
jgi:hypothetical protein